MTLEDCVSRSPDIVAREVGGETVLLDLAGGTYFGLNEVGGKIWAMLESGPHSLVDICAALLEEYDVTRDDLETDVLALAGDLQAQGLVTIG